jgi:peptide/nickel transport system ATP-binding protein
MDMVGLAERFNSCFPHEISGGLRQRAGIARALATNPQFIVCDEPVSSLDVSIQAQIINLLMDLQDNLKLTYMFITHDLSVVRHISKTIAVMYLGQCVEMAPSKEIFRQPKHPYTQALLKAIPSPTLKKRSEADEDEVIKGEISNPINPKPGCRFADRCPLRTIECDTNQLFREVNSEHFVACHLAV